MLFRTTVPEMVASMWRRPTPRASLPLAAVWFIVICSSPVSEQLAGKVITGATGVEQKEQAAYWPLVKGTMCEPQPLE